MRKNLKVFRMMGIALILTMALTLIPFAPPSLAAPQDDSFEVKTMDLQISPEYDDPRVLAVISGTLVNTSGKEYNGRVYFNVPKDIEVNMACEIVNGSGHSCQPYEIEDKGSYQVLSWKITRTINPGEEYPIWLEYYYNPLKGTPDKTMTLEYIPYYKTLELKTAIKEPLKSSNFKLDPAPTTTGQDGEGFKNDYYTFQNIDSTTPVVINISYTKNDNKPSIEKQQPDSGQQAGTSELGTSAWKKPEVLIPVILFVIVLIIFIFYSLNSSRNVSPKERITRIQNKYGDSNTKPKKHAGSNNNASEKKRIRQMLLDGEISEETYRELMENL